MTEINGRIYTPIKLEHTIAPDDARNMLEQATAKYFRETNQQFPQHIQAPSKLDPITKEIADIKNQLAEERKYRELLENKFSKKEKSILP